MFKQTNTPAARRLIQSVFLHVRSKHNVLETESLFKSFLLGADLNLRPPALS